MTVAGVVVLFLGLVVAGAGAGLALFERLPPRGSLRLMGLGIVVGAVGFVVTLLSADEGESLDATAYVPLALVVAIVAYAASFARRAGRVGPTERAEPGNGGRRDGGAGSSDGTDPADRAD
jgi:hypothetical protein